MKAKLVVLGVLAVGLLLVSAASAQKASLYPQGVGCYLIGEGAELSRQSEPQFIRGDYDASGDLAMPDALGLLLWKYHQPGGVAPTCEDAADYDDSGDIAMPDALGLLLWKYHQPGGVPPPPPFPGCGPDPTEPDGLGCVSYSPCGWPLR